MSLSGNSGGRFSGGSGGGGGGYGDKDRFRLFDRRPDFQNRVSLFCFFQQITQRHLVILRNPPMSRLLTYIRIPAIAALFYSSSFPNTHRHQSHYLFFTSILSGS